MYVDKIIPCICTDHPPNVAESVHYGMPQLKVSSYNGKQLFTAYCPVCGRGDAFEFKSAYLALKDWNDMQVGLYEFNKREIVYEESYEEYEERLINKTVTFIIDCVEITRNRHGKSCPCFLSMDYIKSNVGLTSKLFFDFLERIIDRLKKSYGDNAVKFDANNYSFTI